MPLELDGNPHVFRLGDRVGNLLQVLLPELTLTRGRRGVTADIEIHDDLLCIRDSEGKQAVRRAVPMAARTDLASRLDRFESDPDMISYRLDARDAPLRHANGGVLPILRLDGIHYACLFYRESFPRGWNLANGASDTVEELLRPETIVFREFSEELLVADRDSGLLFCFDPEDIPDARRAFDRSVAAWANLPGHEDLAKCEVVPVPLKWIEGPDRVRIREGSRSETTTRCFLSITIRDGAVELDRISLINLKGPVSIYDGELLGDDPIDRIVGLFEVDGLEGRLDADDFRPDRMFHGGEEMSPKRLEERIEAYLEGRAFQGRSRERRRLYREDPDPRFDLCPITRSILGRYFRWKAEDARETPRSAASRRPSATGVMPVFLSFRTPDLQIARWVHDELRERSVESFFSPETLVKLGASDYAAAIDGALEAADSLVVVGTRPEHFHSGWVGYEWRSFLNEIRSGRKSKGRIFTFSHGVTIEELPYALRQFQNVPYAPSSPQDSLENLCNQVLGS